MPASPGGLPHLGFVPFNGVPPDGGWPLVVYLHDEEHSAPSPLPRLALAGPPLFAGRALAECSRVFCFWRALASRISSTDKS